jgi:release factor glutamine methyltransferase
MRLITLPGVFQPRSDSWLLADVVRGHERVEGARVLDLCTGSGVLAIAASLAGAGQVTAVDLSRRAVLTALLNAWRNGARVHAVRGDLFAAVAGARFDLIVSNPPYLPAPDGRVPRRGAARAWDAGRDGRAVLDRICGQASHHLAPGGSCLLIHSSLIGVEQTLGLLSARGLEPSVLLRRRGRLGPLLSQRAGALEQLGMLAPGEREEDIVVIEAVQPRSARTATAAALDR